MKYYIDIEHEASFDKPETDPEPQWPRHASVAFINVCARYRPGLPLVVKDLTFDVKAGQKVGVVGQYSEHIVATTAYHACTGCTHISTDTMSWCRANRCWEVVCNATFISNLGIGEWANSD